MPLYFSGRAVETLDGLSIRATELYRKDHCGKGFHEAI